MAHYLFAGKPQYLLKLPQGPKLRMNRRVRWFRRSARPVRQWPQWSNARAHTSVLERRKSEASVLRDFEEAGELVIYEEFGQDIADIAHLAQQVWEKGLLYAVALDPYGVGAIVDALNEVGISGQDQIVGISQGWKLTGAIKTAEHKLADGTLRHSSQKLMSWAVANARVEPKGNAIIITKQASGSAKIDPLMAAFNAIALMSTNPGSTRPSLFII